METEIAALPTLRHKLRRNFGLRSFRPGQLRAIRNALNRQDTLVLMPTGSGKSLCFQLPALEMPGIAVVISPLIALMKDQCDSLCERGLRARMINSSVPPTEIQETLSAIGGREVDFIYTTPEQIAAPELIAVLNRAKVGLFVVDEAHCVSQWGHDFRPEYLLLNQAIHKLGDPPVLVFPRFERVWSLSQTLQKTQEFRVFLKFFPRQPPASSLDWGLAAHSLLLYLPRLFH